MTESADTSNMLTGSDYDFSMNDSIEWSLVVVSALRVVLCTSNETNSIGVRPHGHHYNTMIDMGSFYS